MKILGMEAFIQNVFYNPLPIIGATLSVLAVVAILVLMRGFLSGVMYLFTLNGNDDFLLHARIRVLWGFLLLVFFFSLWEVIRWIAALITGGAWPGGLSVAVTLLLMLFVIQWAVNLYTNKEKGP